jgi:class 3 adenylate cyclase
MQVCPECGTANLEAAKFCHGCGARLSTVPEPRRRLVTALFCDLVGSTELGERLDPEPLRKLLDRYFDVMAATIEHHGGTVEKFIGDAVVGTFGVPVAHEDDAYRAVRAAREMVKAAEELDKELSDPGLRVRVRIAISSGEAFADEGAAKGGRIGGDVYNTAARLQAAAEPGDVVVSGSTEPMLRGRVDLAALGQVELKGKAEESRSIGSSGFTQHRSGRRHRSLGGRGSSRRSGGLWRTRSRPVPVCSLRCYHHLE